MAQTRRLVGSIARLPRSVNASLRLTLWPGGKEEVLAIGDTHGEQLRWLR